MVTRRGEDEPGPPDVSHSLLRPTVRGRRPSNRPRPSTGSSGGGIPYETGDDRLESQRLAAIVEASDDAIVSKTLDGTVSYWNPGATRISGYTAGEMVGSPITRIVPVELQDEEAEILAKLARGERIDHYETVRLVKGGRHITVSLSVSPLRDAAGKVVGASKIARNITSRKETEDALRSANDALRSANEALRNANEVAHQLRMEAENANRAKTDFLAAMSHEIRTPLNCIKGVVYLLTKSTELTLEQRRYVDLVKNASAALLTTVDDILDFSKVEAGQMDLELRPFKPSTLIHDTVAIVAPSAKAKSLELTCAIDAGAPEWVLGDQRRLRQVLFNLLSNAVKFTAEGSIQVCVRSQVAADGRGEIYFSVTDTGVGVPKEHQSRLFRQFSQADSSVSRRYGGTGLGLAICKRLVELMDGKIGIVSDVGQGSTVWFTARLPSVSEPAPAPASERSLDRVDDRTFRILVVDDVDTNLEIVEAFLQDSGYHVVCVSSGLEAIQVLGGASFDLVLMDVQMPMMDGVTATQRIRALPAPIGNIPIIAMTGHVMPREVKTFLEAGMNGHVGKPIERAKLHENIRRWLPSEDKDNVRVKSMSFDFDRSIFDTFLRVLGAEKAERIAAKFLKSLTCAFKSTFTETQREAHCLINVAGMLGLSGLVRACRRIAEFAPTPTPECGGEALQELQQAQLRARQTLTKHLLPKLRRISVRPGRLRA